MYNQHNCKTKANSFNIRDMTKSQEAITYIYRGRITRPFVFRRNRYKRFGLLSAIVAETRTIILWCARRVQITKARIGFHSIYSIQ